MKPASFVELLKGERAELALLTTYNFEPAFFEECLLRTRSLGEARRIVVFVDASEWTRSDKTRVRGLNCRYLVVPMQRKRGVFHPKLTLLLGAKSAALICGSANLSRAGCTHNLEMLNSFPFSFDENAAPPEQAHLLADALAFFRECAASAPEGLRGLLRGWLDELPLALPWLPGVLTAKPNAGDCQLRHTLAGDLWSVIRAELSGRTPRVVRVLSPFYDDDLALAARIRSEWPGCRVEITAQQNTSAVPVNALAALGPKVTLHELRGAGSRRLHAKLCAFEHARGTFFIAGSANFTTAAFDGRNVETCLVWHDRETGFDDLFAGEITRRPIAAEDFDSSSETPPELRAAPAGSGWQLHSAVLDESDRLQFQFTPPPSGSSGLAAHLFVESETRPVLAVPVAANARGSGESQLADGQSALLQGPVRCELRLGTHASGSAWLVQAARLTHEASGGGDRATERERLIHETGTGLLEKLAEIARTEGHIAVVEYLARLNIRFLDEGGQPHRRFAVKPHDPFRPDELPSWLLLPPEMLKDYGAAVIEFVARHEQNIFRRHARRPSLGGLTNFQDVLLAVTRLLYDTFANGALDFSRVVGFLCDAVEIFGLGIESETKGSPGYTAGLLENLAGSRSEITDAFHEHNTLAILRVALLTAQRARAGLHQGDAGTPHPLTTAQEKFARFLSTLRMKPPARVEMEAALQSLTILTPEQIALWLQTA